MSNFGWNTNVKLSSRCEQIFIHSDEKHQSHKWLIKDFTATKTSFVKVMIVVINGDPLPSLI